GASPALAFRASALQRLSSPASSCPSVFPGPGPHLRGTPLLRKVVMGLSDFFRRYRNSKDRAASERRSRARRTRLFLERLEERLAPAISLLSTSLPTQVDSAGKGLLFNGNNTFLTTPNLRSSFPNESVTVEFWFKPEAPGVLMTELGQPTINTG